MPVAVNISVRANKYPEPLPIKYPPSIRILFQNLAGSADSCIIPFSRAGNLILIKAKADTTEGNFILDTGAPGLVLNLTYFRDYPVTTDANEEQSGITGSVASVKKTQVGKLIFDCVTGTGITADLVNLGHIENARGIRIFGLIGLSILRQFEMIIDYENSLLYLYRIPKKNTASFKSSLLKDESAYNTVPIEIWNNKVVTRTTIAGKKLRLIIDTGAESNMLDSRLPNKIFENVEILRRIKLTGAGDKKVEALFGNINNLTIGGQNTGVLPVIITNLEKTCLADNSCIDGILGFDFLSLHKIGFNFVNNKMFIWK
ncbi:MAG: aspartyl protease family protein [Ferruginibacter sp.]|nr:aspartyl protease family protein [Ferruginibacter sp.]